MNKKLPFEEAFEQQMKDLSSLHEDESWQKMKKLLDENDKRRPFAFLKNYKTSLALLIFLLIGFWLMIQHINSKEKAQVAAAAKPSILQQKTNTNNAIKAPVKPNSQQQRSGTNPSMKQKNSEVNMPTPKASITPLSAKNNQRKKLLIQGKRNTYLAIDNNRIKRNNTFSNKQTHTRKAEFEEMKEVTSSQNNLNSSAKPLPVWQKNEVADTAANATSIQQKKLTVQLKDTSAPKSNSETKDIAEALKTPSNSNKKYFISAGLEVQQQVPLAGQKIVSYGYKGSKSAFSDYIPAVYFRLEKDMQWFLQGGFSYGAPQLVKEFSYSRQTQANYFAASTTTTSLHLKKTFYNEIPVSFNYYIRRNWSAGIGGMYSWFHGAIAEQDVTTKSTQSPTQSISSQIVPINSYTDSFLYKSHTYLLLQTEYKWRRLSAGLRYTRDIQPYIKYTLPDGTVTEKRNWALEFILRFQIWKSEKF